MMPVYWVCRSFLSCLCGSEPPLSAIEIYLIFLSCLCGSELKNKW